MSQRIISGLGSISKLINILENREARNILLVTGKKSFLTSGAAEALDPVFKRFNATRFHDFEINPKLEDALKGTEIARKKNSVGS